MEERVEIGMVKTMTVMEALQRKVRLPKMDTAEEEHTQRVQEG
jgi:hypothetical protein